uniref:Uncharacterized protein n=1 Tax=Ascaris lumbricoides TaxID=6252 RepID=A0A0M3IN76_ASCLU
MEQIESIPEGDSWSATLSLLSRIWRPRCWTRHRFIRLQGAFRPFDGPAAGSGPQIGNLTALLAAREKGRTTEKLIGIVEISLRCCNMTPVGGNDSRFAWKIWAEPSGDIRRASFLQFASVPTHPFNLLVQQKSKESYVNDKRIGRSRGQEFRNGSSISYLLDTGYGDEGFVPSVWFLFHIRNFAVFNHFHTAAAVSFQKRYRVRRVLKRVMHTNCVVSDVDVTGL